MNLLASSDSLTYQALAAATPSSEVNAVYNGPYVSGEEYELLLQAERRMDEAWKMAQEDLED